MKRMQRTRNLYGVYITIFLLALVLVISGLRNALRMGDDAVRRATQRRSWILPARVVQTGAPRRRLAYRPRHPYRRVPSSPNPIQNTDGLR
ncbi:hypothetical protein KP509_35G049100 [Ceratopteris richardii]|uniref:Uncharacterized protein n=1 Tax=Ceratopteris richardii TaxID=49495 RepID=A0A8T2QGY0_CERRI|nr:hypothetical protein KP509_35G049100 [Ceratopteris richardii]KAH7282825.1 hypothetical protein KP509_35G049100 [Ceratopteris richardii]